MFVISVTAVKQGYEDFLRYKADNMVNYSDGKFDTFTSSFGLVFTAANLENDKLRQKLIKRENTKNDEIFIDFD